MGHDESMFTAADLASIDQRFVPHGGDMLARSAVTRVYRARSKDQRESSSGREAGVYDLVVKMVELDDPHFTRDMAYREVDIMRSVRHDCLIGYRHHFEHEGRLYIVMEHGSGGSVSQRFMSRREAVDVEEACLVLHDVARGMAYLHGGGGAASGRHAVAHRDLK